MEAKADATEKAYCDEQLAKTEEKRADLEHDISTLATLDEIRKLEHRESGGVARCYTKVMIMLTLASVGLSFLQMTECVPSSTSCCLPAVFEILFDCMFALELVTASTELIVITYTVTSTSLADMTTKSSTSSITKTTETATSTTETITNSAGTAFPHGHTSDLFSAEFSEDRGQVSAESAFQCTSQPVRRTDAQVSAEGAFQCTSQPNASVTLHSSIH